ncbi:MAG: hypothetical protein M3345_01845, partial [Actinomycetota bacterium]|nr:hypothetical protein [Actinomycetota bacterium]
MTTYLLLDDALRSPEMRHEIGEPIMDPIGFIDHDGHRVVLGGVLERPSFENREDVVDEFWDVGSFGWAKLMEDRSVAESDIWPEIVVRALAKIGTGE